MEQDQDERNKIDHTGEAAQQEAPFLRVENLTKTFSIPYDKLQVLRDVDLYVRRGEFIAITGPSGSGKTTLLSLLGALDSPDSGEIWLEERAVHRLRGTAAADYRREQVGFVFQLFYLLPNLTALENVMAPLLPYRRKLSFDLKNARKNCSNGLAGAIDRDIHRRGSQEENNNAWQLHVHSSIGPRLCWQTNQQAISSPHPVKKY